MNTMLGTLLVGLVAAGAILLQSNRAVSAHGNPIAFAATTTATPAPTQTPRVGPAPRFARRTPAPPEMLGPPPGSRFAYFNPTRPPGATLHTARGVFDGLGYGNKSGGFAITTASGASMGFVAPIFFKINGVRLSCFVAPHGSFPGDGCPHWPTKLVSGKTRVRVTFWRTKDPQNDEIVDASDQIDF